MQVGLLTHGYRKIFDSLARQALTGAFVMLLITGCAHTTNIKGRVILKSGEPVSNVTVTIHDSWASLLTMRERELSKAVTAPDGTFQVIGLKHQHNIIFRIEPKNCAWGRGTFGYDKRNQVSEDTYAIELVLYNDNCK